MRRWIGSAALLLTVVGCGAGSSGASALDPRTAVVRVSDLPPGTRADPGRYWSNAQAARRDGVTAAQYAAHGRVRSYTSDFWRPLAGGIPTGPTRADSEVSVYTSAANAHWAFATLRRQLRRGYAVGAPGGGASFTNPAVNNTGYARYPYRVVAVPHLGDEDAGFSTLAPGDELNYQTWTVLLREGRYLADVRVVGIDGMIPLKDALAIARRVDARLRG